jgi:hypothetical protein
MEAAFAERVQINASTALVKRDHRLHAFAFPSVGRRRHSREQRRAGPIWPDLTVDRIQPDAVYFILPENVAPQSAKGSLILVGIDRIRISRIPDCRISDEIPSCSLDQPFKALI